MKENEVKIIQSNEADIEKQSSNDNNINKIEHQVIKPVSGKYDLTAIDLEELMGKYKERGVNYQDLIALEEMGGPDVIIAKLKSDPVKGISDDSNRENDFGSNKVFVEPVPSFCSYVYEALEDLMIRILIVAAFIQIILGATLSDDPGKDWVDGLSIIIAVLVVVLVGSITNWEKETKFHQLNDLQNEGTHYTVIRKGQPVELHSDDLLVGDLINIIVGDIIPADVMLIEGNGIKMDESSLTGESETLRKEVFDKSLDELKKKASKPSSPCILSGTNCVEGSGLAIILAVGEHSQKGIIKRTVDNAQENNQTPLEIKLDAIAEKIGWFGMGAGAITLVALFIRFGVNFVGDKKAYRDANLMKGLISSYVQNNPGSMTDPVVNANLKANLTNPEKNVSNQILDIILLCVSIIVVAIPEGLPLAVTLSLAFSIKKLMDQNNLVRKMDACETMGGANYICTDKTGTLTKNEMNIYKVLNGKQEILLKETQDDSTAGQINNQNNQSKKIRENPKMYFPNETYWNLLKTSIGLNLDGTIKTLTHPTPEGDTEVCETKNKTDNAFIDFLYRFQSLISLLRNKYILKKDNVKQFPFDSKRKRMTTVIKSDLFPTGYRLFTKGGAENVKTICQGFVDPDTGENLPMDDKELILINDTIEKFNKQMLRSLYVCYKDITEDQFNDFEKKNEFGLLIDQYDLSFVGVVGIRDSLRNGVKEAVSKCKEASVNVIMVTGDNIITAVAIAKDCNILDSKFDLENMKPEDIEDDQDSTNNPSLKEKHIKEVLEIKPTAITGNTFYNAIGGLICKCCLKDTGKCTCPKTEAEAKERAEKTGKKEKVKIDSIQYMDKFIELTKRLKVMARSQPVHKYALVLGLKEMNYVVAVTGDGTNDAPALSKSDIGFAMFAGTDIAKEASDIVIMDNNFSSIVVAIIYGRNIYDNIRKFLQFQLTVNFCACLLVFICACIGNETPLTPIQMLWVNLIMDSLGSLALATEPPYEALLKREPTKRSESIINGKMWKHIGFQSLIQLIILLFLYLYAPHFIIEDDYVRLAENETIKYCYGKLPGKINDTKYIIFGTNIQWKAEDKLLPRRSPFDCGKYASRQDLSIAFNEYINSNGSSAHMSIVFNVFVVYTLFNQLNSRTLDDSFNIFVRIIENLFFPLITLVELILQIIIIEFGNAGFHVAEKGLTARQWGITIGFSMITFVVSIIIKLIPIDKPIQKFLDREVASDNKVANEEDLLQQSKEHEVSQIKLINKNDINLNIINNKENNQNQSKDDSSSNNQSQEDNGNNKNKKPKRNSSIINPRAIKKGNSLSKKSQGSLRIKKADVSITNN